MKWLLSFVLTVAGTWSALAQPGPTTVIVTTVAPATSITIAQTVTVTMRVANYSSSVQIDAFNCIVNYDTNIFAFVSNSFNVGNTSGTDQQWLSKPNQESQANGYTFVSWNDGSVPGQVGISIGDLGINDPEQGTTASSGFLTSFQLIAVGPGTGSIATIPFADGSVLLDVNMLPFSGVVQLNGVTVQVLSNAVPLVSITSPTEGSSFNAPSKITVSASASSGNGSITNLEFFAEATNKIGQANSAPFLVNWTNPPSGAHTLTAKATDVLGASAVSSPVHIIVNAFPTVALTSPTNNAFFNSPATVTMNATAADSDGTISRVEFYAGITLLNIDSNAPFSFSWSGVATGAYVLTAKAFDDQGAATVSSPINIVVGTNAGAPSMVAAGAQLESESGPVNGGIDPGETVTLRFLLKNTGLGDTANLTGTLQTSGGVTSPSSAQNYGVLAAHGPAIGKSFSFTAFGSGGGTITATLALQDGTNSYGNVTYIFNLGGSTNLANISAINIPDSGAATTLYPSTIVVSGMTGLVSKVTVTISNLTHSFPQDVDMLVVSPDGQKVMMMSDAGSTASAVTLTFDDSSVNILADTGTIVSGTYQPIDYETGETMPSPAPAGPYATNFSAFRGSNPNGTWKLYVADDTAGDSGRIANGWILNLTTFDPVNAVADLAIAVTDIPDPVLIGSNVAYTVTVTNKGPEDVVSVTVTNVLPSGMSLVSATPSQGSCSNVSGKVICDLGSLASSNAATVSLILTTTNTGTKTLTATVVTTGNDFNNTNNVASATTTVNGVANLALTLTASPNPVYLNNTLTYTLKVTNSGPSTASSVVVTNLLPSGISYVSATPSQGSCSQSAGVVTCNLGSVANAGQATVTIVCTAPGTAGTLADLAGAWSTTPDLATNNNTATLAVANLNPSFVIMPAAAWLVSESGPVTGGIDVGETVSVGFYLKNIGTSNTTNLTAILLATGGVTSPSGATNYGALVANGAAVVRTNSFTASGVAGGLLTATLQIQEGSISLGTVSFSFPLGKAYSLTNSTLFSIPDDAAASLYPSSIAVSNINGAISKATVTLNNFTHAYLADVDMLLVSPAGQKALLLSDVGGNAGVANLTFTLDDSAGSYLPQFTAMTAGSWKPTDFYGGAPDSFSSPAPAGPYATNLAVFNGTNPNGSWSLYVMDDSFGDIGQLGGWSLSLTTVGLINPPATSLSLVSTTTNALFQCTLNGRAGDTYVIEASTNLVNWSATTTNVPVTDASLFIDSASSTNYGQRFYRAVWRP